jgi:hypothetical protein
MLVEARLDHGKRAPAIYWQFLAFDHNVHEIPIAIQKARELGVDMFSVVRPFDVSHDDPEIHPANVAPQILCLNPSADTILLDNWNPFPDALEERVIELEFDSPWGRKVRAPAEEGFSLPSPHTCHWLYKDITMDAHGSIFPCAGAPQHGGHFIFSHIDHRAADNDDDSGNAFNSDKHQAARQFFASGERSIPTRVLHQDDPYCYKCCWNQLRPDIDNLQAENYLRAASPELFTDETLRMLCNW